ncbi:ROK family protein [Candidatus Saccharibacteria bacterium]|nr:ROK family protein [Candidatus Saccharibacteria bacterium]
MYLCIDIGGTKTIVALVSSTGEVLHSVRFATISDQNIFYENLLQQIRVNFVLSGIKAISIAMPGIIKRNQAVWLGNLPWHDFDLAKLLQRDLSDIPVFVENDANLAALAEARLCKGRSLYLTFSTGIGGGIVEDGQLVKRYSDFEPGHTEFVFEGKTKEWEDIAAASAINAKYGRLVSTITEKDIWSDVIDRMLLGLTPITISLHPDRIIFGGPLGLMLPSYRKELKKRLAASLPADHTPPRLHVAKYHDLSVIYGCYYYAKLKLAAK